MAVAVPDALPDSTLSVATAPLPIEEKPPGEMAPPVVVAAAEDAVAVAAAVSVDPDDRAVPDTKPVL